MSDELLQAEAVAPVETENLNDTTSTEPLLQESGSAPEAGENQPEKIKFDEGQQKVVDDLMAKKTFKVREAEREGERKLQELQKQFDEVKAKIPQEVRPEIPPIPDQYDDDYEVKIQARDDVIRQVVEFDTSQAAIKSQQEATTQAQLKEQQEARDKTVGSYNDRANKLGVDTQKLVAAETKLVELGINQALGSQILEMGLGPLAPIYLADPSNIAEFDALNRMSLGMAAIELENVILPKIKAAQSGKQPTAPDPVETLNGSGVAPVRNGLKGVTYS